ncbi:cytochrome P450 [Pyronema omphalodes]|nr:cytochrome P450 [Pyronema omphalodes]
MGFHQHIVCSLAAIVFLRATLYTELDYEVIRLSILFLSVCSFNIVFLVLHATSFLPALFHTLSLAATFLITLTLGIFLHRVLFHRINHFPGPFLAKVSKIYTFIICWRRPRRFEYHAAWHKQHGDIVRVGPRDLSINSINAVALIYGSASLCQKSSFYSQTFSEGHGSIFSIRNKKLAAHRRRAWDRAMSGGNLVVYTPRLEHFCSLLLRRIGEKSERGQEVDLTKMFRWFSFDAIGEVGTGKSYGMLDNNKEHEAVEALLNSQWWVGIAGVMPWVLRMLLIVPMGKDSGIYKFMKWTSDQVELKTKEIFEKDEKRTILGLLLDDKATGRGKVPQSCLLDDARSIVAAGSDTVATALAGTFYFLVRHPEILKKLRQTLDEAFPSGQYDPKVNVPYLDACINETLRLQPPVPCGLLRTTPMQGLTIDGVFIPGNINVSVPTQLIHRDPRYWKKPNDYWPERWIEGVGDGFKVFMPFTVGSYACTGRPLAWLEMRMTIAKILLRFDVEQSGSLDDWEARIDDYFGAQVPSLNLKITERTDY